VSGEKEMEVKNTKPRKILIVDDDPDMLDQLTIVLTPSGANIVRADCAKDGETCFEAEKPDLAIVDLMMETADAGFTLCYRMKRMSPKTPVIVLTSVTAETGMSFDRLTPEARSWIKADAFLNKPIRGEELVQEIDRLLV
jgi:DNA-binding response OmpR family regulator